VTNSVDLIELSRAIRANSLRMVSRAKASHIASALSSADILATLYGKVMHYDSNQPNYSDRDRFILSKGHACVAVYATLAEAGFIKFEELLTYGDNESRLMNHVSHKVPGVEFSTGSLGHGLPFGAGKALVCKKAKKTWRVFVLLGDGEMDEGSNWEALMFAAHHNLNNLTMIIDCNNLQSLTTVKDTLSLEPLADKLSSFGWDCVDIDGHNFLQLEQALSYSHDLKPRAVIARTIKGKGVSFMEHSVDWHYKNPSSQELEMALAELDILK
jgi:transketolase